MSFFRVASPWDGFSRAPLRNVLAALLVADAALTAFFVGRLQPSALSHPNAPRWLLSLGGNLPALGLCVLLALVAAAHFARGAGRVVSGVVAIAVVGLLVEAHAALLDGPMRFLFFSGAAATGWCFGLVFARWQGLRLEEPSDAEAVEALAEQGAVAVLAACYLGALTSKLSVSGLAWVTTTGLQATLAAQHVWGHSTTVDAIVVGLLGHAGIAKLLSAFTLLAQASAAALPFGRRGRAVAATALLLFHAGVWLLTPIAFPQAMVLLAAFGFPWGRAFPSLTLPRPAPPPSRGLRPTAASRGAIVWAIAIALAFLPAVRRYTSRHHDRHEGGAHAPLPVTPAPSPAGQR